MKTTLILFLSLTYIASQAQTKLIAHKSHSGSNANFSTAFANDLFDIDEDNLGMAPERYEIKKKHMHPQLDSVIFVSENKAIVVTSNYCTMENVYYKEETKKEIWTPGKEIANNHPLFSKQHSLDSIKKVLKDQYGFENPIDDVVFVGYDNKNEEKIETAPLAEDTVVSADKKTKRKRKLDAEGTVLVVLGLTLATFISGLLMLNRNN
jgi:hypothetical protein